MLGDGGRANEDGLVTIANAAALTTDSKNRMEATAVAAILDKKNADGEKDPAGSDEPLVPPLKRARRADVIEDDTEDPEQGTGQESHDEAPERKDVVEGTAPGKETESLERRRKQNRHSAKVYRSRVENYIQFLELVAGISGSPSGSALRRRERASAYLAHHAKQSSDDSGDGSKDKSDKSKGISQMTASSFLHVLDYGSPQLLSQMQHVTNLKDRANEMYKLQGGPAPPPPAPPAPPAPPVMQPSPQLGGKMPAANPAANNSTQAFSSVVNALSQLTGQPLGQPNAAQQAAQVQAQLLGGLGFAQPAQAQNAQVNTAAQLANILAGGAGVVPTNMPVNAMNAMQGFQAAAPQLGGAGAQLGGAGAQLGMPSGVEQMASQRMYELFANALHNMKKKD